LERVTKPFFSVIADLKEEPLMSQSDFCDTPFMQNVVATTISNQGYIFLMTFFL
jgi:hypothetical protein